ncbi:MAG TPA: imidazolonepropionase [Oceanospirillaceae bacterium]|nr:imidazolonepropionase [Oceanospirillaceae bacterium]
MTTLWHGFDMATMVGGQYNLVADAAMVTEAGKITWLGKVADAPATDIKQDMGGGLVTPGLIDCHSHIVFAGNRSGEFEMRMQGADYAAIAKAGGGIVATVIATREASEDALFEQASRRLKSLMADGVTSIEIKSGYGLDEANELKMLRVARRLGQEFPVNVRTSCLAAHALPKEYAGRDDDYIDLVCKHILSAAAKENLADAVDGFCEGIAFSPAQMQRVFNKAQELGLPVKLHAEQLSDLGGAAMAAGFGALSVDHLEYLNEKDIAVIKQAGSVAVILPGAFYSLRETQLPPIKALREAGVPMAIASDANPGSAPVLSLRLMMNMGCVLFGMTPEETLAGATCHGARALGMQDTHGQLAVGMAADFVCWDVTGPADLSYWQGGQLVKQRVVAGNLT